MYKENQTASGAAIWEDWQEWKASDVRRWAAWTSLHVQGRHQLVLDLLAAHPLLTSTDLAAILDLDAGTVLRYLTDVEHLGLVVANLPSQDVAPSTDRNCRHNARAAAPGYALSQLGVYLLATSAGIPMRRSASSPVSATDASVRMGYDPGISYASDVASLRRIAEHTRGVYTFFALLHQAFRTNRNAETYTRAAHTANVVRWWETGRACMRHYRVQHGWRAIRPDGAAEVAIGGRQVVLWLEWDRSTMGLRDLRAKFTAYAEYVRSREWRTDGNTPLPLLLVVTGDTDAETRVARALTDAETSSTPLGIRIASASGLREHGPLGTIWRPWLPGTAPSRLALGPPSPLMPADDRRQ